MAAWNDLRQDLRRVYRTIVEHLRALDKWSDDEISLILAIVAHTACSNAAALVRNLQQPLSLLLREITKQKGSAQLIH